MEKRASYWELFTSMFYLSAFTFGGGYVIVPLMEDKFVKELGWIDYDEMLDLIALGQSAPGAIAVNTSVLIGYQRLGVLGAVVSTLGTVLPPLLIMTGLSYIYLLVRDNPYVNNMLLGMSAGVAAIIVNVVYKMARRIIHSAKTCAHPRHDRCLYLSCWLPCSYFMDFIRGGFNRTDHDT